MDKQHGWDLRPWSLSPELLLSHDTTLSLHLSLNHLLQFLLCGTQGQDLQDFQ